MKKIFKIIIIIFVVIALLNVMLVKYEEFTLEKEMESIALLDINTNDFNISLKSNFNYGKVELAVKEYLIEYSKISKEMQDTVNNDRLNSILSADNYQEDGREFTNTLKYLEDCKNDLVEKEKKLDEISTKEKINSYINDKNLNKYYNNLYNKFMYHSNIGTNLVRNTKELKTSVSNISNIIDKEIEVINFLKSSNNWIIKDNNIIFSNNDELNKYNELVKDLI